MNKVKPTLIIALFVLGMFGAPAMSLANAQATTTSSGITTEEGVDQLSGALGQIFGMFRGFGASGDALGTVMQSMFDNFENLTNTKKLDGVYVLNATVQNTYINQEYKYNEGSQLWKYAPWGSYNLKNATNPVHQKEFPYFVFNETGKLTYNLTEGVSSVFIIYDNDNSFIEALDNLITAIKKLSALENSTSEEDKQKAIEIAAETITYFLIHLNDIITGDEVIIFNLIAYSNYEADFLGVSQGTWWVSENKKMTEKVLLTDSVLPGWEAQYKAIAEEKEDQFMKFLLYKEYEQKRLQNYTAFSFDVFEIWLKNFEVHIDVATILQAVADVNSTGDSDALDGKTLTDIFEKLDIEFYIFTHHFQNWYLFDDAKFADTAKYSNPMYAGKAGNGVPDIVMNQTGTYENQSVEMIVDSEVTDYIQFRGADDWVFKEPVYDTVKNSMSWGVRGENLDFRVIPIGMKDDEVNDTISPVETMAFMELGFTFSPYADYNNVSIGEYKNPNGVQTMGAAVVKLDQSFGKWSRDSDGKAFTPRLKTSSLDLTTVFMSTILHVHLLIENKKIAETPEEATAELLGKNNYENETHKIKVGDVDEDLPLAEVDIAGPNYTQTDASGVTTTYKANTTTIPTVYAQWEGQGSETYTQNDNSTGAISANLQIEFSVLLYAVSYYSFDSSGDEIWHDPTFSVFITFEEPGVIAIILVIGTIALVGIAAVLITKKKNKKLDVDTKV
jgi:hypothetical protein